jgi:hypothetical protein
MHHCSLSQGDEMGFTFTIQNMLVFSIQFLVLQGNFQALFHKAFSYLAMVTADTSKTSMIRSYDELVRRSDFSKICARFIWRAETFPDDVNFQGADVVLRSE